MGMAMGLLGTAASMGSGMMQNSAQRRAQAEQEQENNNALMRQAFLRHQEMLRQRQLGFQAGNEFRQNLYDNSGGLAYASNQAREQQRLQQAYAGGTSASEFAHPASDASIQAGSQRGALTGQSGGDSEFRSDLARRLNNAASDARARIAALATMNSYDGSQFSAQNLSTRGFKDAQNNIDMLNNFRRSSLNTYGIEDKMLGQARQVNYRKPGGATALEGAGGILSGLGKGFGGGMF